MDEELLRSHPLDYLNSHPNTTPKDLREKYLSREKDLQEVIDLAKSGFEEARSSTHIDETTRTRRMLRCQDIIRERESDLKIIHARINEIEIEIQRREQKQTPVSLDINPEEVERLKQEINRLIAKRENITEQNKITTKQFNENQEQLQNTSRDLAATEGILKSRRQEQQEVTERLSTLNAQLAAIQEANPRREELHQLHTEIGSLQQTKAHLDGEIGSLRSNLQELGSRQTELNQIDAQLQIKKAELDQLSSNLEREQQTHQQLRDRIQTDEGSHSDLTRRIQTSQADYEDLQRRIQHREQIEQGIREHERTLQQLQSDIETHRQDCERLRQQQQEMQGIPGQLAELKQQLNEKTAHVERLTRQAEALEENRERLENLKIQLATTQADLDRQQGSLQETQQQRNELTSQLKQLEQRIQYLNEANPNQEQREQLFREIENLREQRIQLEEQVGSRHQQIQDLSVQTEQLESRRQELQIIETRLKDSQEQHQSLTGRIPELQREVADLEFVRQVYDDLREQKQYLTQVIDRMRPEVEGLELQKQHILNEINANQNIYQQIEQERNRLRELEARSREVRSDVESEVRRLNQVRGTINSLEQQREELIQDKTRLEREIEEMRGQIKATEDQGHYALQSLQAGQWIPASLPKDKLNWGSSLNEESQFLDRFNQHLTTQGFTFHERTLRAFHTSLKVQDISALVILAGISGTGKSQLPQQYAQYIGAQSITLAVQPRWDSPQDLQGFYNYMEKRYKPTDLIKGLWQYQHQQDIMNDRIVMVLLDEMNLAKVEYYFSDFLSKLENRNNCHLDLDLGSLPLPQEQRRLRIPPQFLFVGTMNEDETTQSLSDKVLDRANVLTFGRPQSLQLREEHQGSPSTSSNHYLPYTRFRAWVRPTDPHSDLVTRLKEDYLDPVNALMDNLGHPFAHRVYQAITRYVVNYPGVTDPGSPAYRQAVADQFGQKLLPKLRGLMVEEAKKELNELGDLITRLGDDPLARAFEQSSNPSQGYGQFQWRGLAYQ